VTHAHSLRLAREDELKRLYADCEIGAMPPLGPLYHQDVIVDEALATGGNVVFEAGSHQASIRMPYGEFERVVRPRVAAFATRARGTRTRPGTSSDIVCGADVSEESAWGWSEHEGQRYYFCSQACKMEFDDNPVEYIRAPM
jgi:YHS domain-containing protein